MVELELPTFTLFTRHSRVQAKEGQKDNRLNRHQPVVMCDEDDNCFV